MQQSLRLLIAYKDHPRPKHDPQKEHEAWIVHALRRCVGELAIDPDSVKKAAQFVQRAAAAPGGISPDLRLLRLTGG